MEVPAELAHQLSREDEVKRADFLYDTQAEYHPSGVVKVTFPNLDAPIEMEFTNWYDGTHRKAEADVEVHYRKFGRERPIFSGRFSLRGPRLKNDFARDCANRATSFQNWGDVVEASCAAAISAFREGTPAIAIRDVGRRQDISYCVWPLIIEQNPSIVFGTGGLGKSLVAGCYTAMRAALGGGYNSTFNDGLVVKKSHNVLYLDWEADPIEVRDRWASIADGLGVTEPPMMYRRMTGPLTAQIESVRKTVLKNEISLVIIDSALPAAGGQAENAEATENFFAALRSLEISSMIIAHQSKPQLGFVSNSPFGSVFWLNEGRSIWQIASEGEPGLNTLQVGLFHRKVNQGGLQKDLGFSIEFVSREDIQSEFGQIIIKKLEISKSDLRKELKLPGLLEAILRDPDDNPTGWMSVEDLATKSNATKKSVQEALSRGKKKGIYVHHATEEKWASPHGYE